MLKNTPEQITQSSTYVQKTFHYLNDNPNHYKETFQKIDWSKIDRAIRVFDDSYQNKNLNSGDYLDAIDSAYRVKLAYAKVLNKAQRHIDLSFELLEKSLNVIDIDKSLNI